MQKAVPVASAAELLRMNVANLVEEHLAEARASDDARSEAEERVSRVLTAQGFSALEPFRIDDDLNFDRWRVRIAHQGQPVEVSSGL